MPINCATVKEEAVDRTVRRTGIGTDCIAVARQNTE